MQKASKKFKIQNTLENFQELQKMQKVTFTFCIQIYKKLGEYQTLNLKTLQIMGATKNATSDFHTLKFKIIFNKMGSFSHFTY